MRTQAIAAVWMQKMSMWHHVSEQDDIFFIFNIIYSTSSGFLTCTRCSWLWGQRDYKCQLSRQTTGNPSRGAGGGGASHFWCEGSSWSIKLWQRDPQVTERKCTKCTYSKQYSCPFKLPANSLNISRHVITTLKISHRHKHSTGFQKEEQLAEIWQSVSDITVKVCI